MPIRPEFLVRNAAGNPMPSPELVQRLRERGGPDIGLFYTKASWAVTQAWGEHDPRRERIKKGEMQPEYAFDICGYLPITCSLDEAPAYIARELASPSFTKEMFPQLRRAIAHWNDTVVEEQSFQATMGAVSNDLDQFNIVEPGVSAPVAIDLSDVPSTPTVAVTGDWKKDQAAVAAASKAVRTAKSETAAV